MNVIKKRLKKQANIYQDKKTTKDIIYCTEDDILNHVIDPAFIINNKDYIDTSLEDTFKALEKAGMKLNGNNIGIPSGSTIIDAPTIGNEFIFKLPNGSIVTLDIENLKEYIKKEA